MTKIYNYKLSNIWSPNVLMIAVEMENAYKNYNQVS